MNWDALGAVGEIIGAVAVLVTLGYLAIQIRQNTAQQKRDTLIAIQHGQNALVAQMGNPAVMQSFALTAAHGRSADVEHRARALTWVIQYLNHFQIVRDMHAVGALEPSRYALWEGFAVAMVAPPGMREWWHEESGRLAFMPDVRDLVERKLADTQNPPPGIDRMWSMFSATSWEARPSPQSGQS